ncbi:MAG TPA: hypothetical protein VMR21_10560, partial [Vicinamibacteria bacterium]|nr:hypothetical protein [Vicinamibacteria bacterium]
HWREARLERRQPDQPLRESRAVLGLGVVSVAVYGARLLLQETAVGPLFAYVPIVGGVLEITAVFFFWMALLQAWRLSRPLRREWALWTGVFLALVPPVTDFLQYVLRARP